MAPVACAISTRWAGWHCARSACATGSPVGLGHLGADEAAALKRERAVLARLRFGLHLVARRPEERLRFDYQKTLAARLASKTTPRASVSRK